MWNEPDPDPGGKAPEGATSSRELTDLKDQNEQQQLMIAQLKEMLRKEQSLVPQEKVEEYINTLSKVKAKKSRTKRDESGSTERGAGIDSHQKERLNLLKQQLEENKAKLAERGKNQKGIEEMVSQLKAQLNDSQQIISPLSSGFEPKNLDYNKNSSSEELYNILLVKERKITDLMSKTQKQEATILDLQENLKEKDSVIDARTKAITLMSDSLSKKGKDTLDALDDTKEQMRVMQENFIKLESEMKARQKVLLNDLKTKNLEIAELQELNHNLIQENKGILRGSEESEKPETDDTDAIIKNLQEKLGNSNIEIDQHKDKIAELEKQLSESLDDLERLKNTGATVAPKDNDGEVAKLKKQLEENNKSMIKLKAQSKSKIKDLTKKIEAFKKMSDANALIVQLQNENTKLSEKIAELEEEKGNMQLKMVESTESSKDFNVSEEFKLLEKDLEDSKAEILEKNKIINLLEEDIVSLKDEIKSLSEKITSFSHLENVQVTNEMKSIQIEEELDKLTEENLSLKKEIEALFSERVELNEKIDNLMKEKSELNTKLENYLQENMELIDKMEKLSAEKVSSAESIEIVEGLTQQEKLELAAYQKNIEEPMKCSQDEENLEASPPELNESVMQLTEDSDELLKKIEMFNAERKEVMIKMEKLKEENNRLIMRVNEIENNRDILAETYEQVQTEKEELQQKNEELLIRISKMEEMPEHKAESNDSIIGGTDVELARLQGKYEELLCENEQLKQSLKDFDAIMQEKYHLESEFNISKSKAVELESKLKNNLEELTNYQCIIEENKNELINSSNIINDLQLKLNERENDIRELNELINDLNRIVSNLQAENEKLGNFELMEAQVDELKSALNKQIEQAEDYNEEMERSNEKVETLNDQLEQMKKKILETEHEMEMRDIELHKLENDLVQKDAIIANLQQQVDEKDHKINAVIEEMKQKYLSLQKNLDGNNESVEKRIEELATKNKEQLEKMKKIAANLRKKTQALQDLEVKYNNDKEKWEVELNEKHAIISDKSNKIAELTNALHETEQVKVDLQHLLQETKQKQEKITTEVSLQQELSTSLHEEYDNTIRQTDRNSANEDKLKELELIIETNEAELAHFKERSQHLEECVMKLTEEKDSLNRQGCEMEQQLSEMSKNMEDKMLLEIQLTDKLREREQTHEELNKKLDETSEEHRELSQKFKEQEELVTKLKVKLKKAHEKVTQLKAAQANLEEMEKVNVSLKKQLEELEVNQKHSQMDHEEVQRRNRMELEKIEADYQAQMAQLSDSRNHLNMECERLNEQLRDMKEKEVDLTSELNEYRLKIAEMEAEDAHQIQKLSDELKMARDNWKVAINQIETLSEQLEDVRKQIVHQSAQEAVDNVLSKAVLAVYDMNTVETQTDNHNTPIESIILTDADVVKASPGAALPTFQWPEGAVELPVAEAELTAQQTSNWFDGAQFVDSQALKSAGLNNIENSRDELAKKVKALEFLLYNIDREKEEVVKECTGMVNELTRLVYDKVSNSKINQPLMPDLDLESQILSQQDIVDATSNNTTNTSLQELEFTKCDSSLGQQSQPVVEEGCQMKQAYQTYQPVVVPEPFGENDDGWGCFGPEEARLEEEHIQRTESTPQVQTLKNEITQLTSKLHSIQAERDNYIEEIKQLQAKLAKVLKKCKELKAKNDQLLLAGQKSSKKSEGSDFFDLDATIQEELKSQISHLEKRLKEINVDLEKEKLEKSNILKKCDVLATANDRMVEMKEIQDSEILRWKRKFEEVEERLQKHDWNNSDGFSEARHQPVTETDEGHEDLEELKNTIKELSIDNEELQALLNEQRNLRIEAEKTTKAIGTNAQYEERISILEKQLCEKCKELEVLAAEKEQSISQLKNLVEEKQKLLEELTQRNNELETTIFTLRDEQSSNQAEYKIHLDSIVNEKDSSIAELKRSLENMRTINEELGEQVEILQSNLHVLQQKYQHLESTNAQLQNQVDGEQEKNRQDQLVQQLEQQSAKFNQQESDYLMKIAEIEKDLLDNKQIVDSLQRELDEQKELLVVRLQEKEMQDVEKIAQLEEELARQRTLKEELKQSYVATIENLEKEIAFNSQVGQQSSNDNDVLLLLQEKESEIEQLKIVIDDLNNVKLILEEGLQKASEEMEQKQKLLTKNLEDEMQQKLADTVQELEQRWQEQVDERGNTVAESWKYHLTMVETEFASVQEKLKAEIDELEAKCNALVNENNELRKNVDAEIRNEVDRVAAMQQQITERQQTIQELQKENEALRVLEQQVNEKESALASLKVIADTTQQQFEEKREVVEEIVKILERNAPWPLSCDKQTVVSEFERQLADLSEKDQEITRLNARIIELQIQFNSSQEKEAEIFRLRQQIATLQEKESEIERLRDIESQLQKMIFDLQTREEQETARFNNIIEDYKVQVTENQLKVNQLMDEKIATTKTIEEIQHNQEELRLTYEQLRSTVVEKDREISSLKLQLEQTEALKNDNNKDVEHLQQQITQQKQDLASFEQALADCQNQLYVANQELQEKTNQLHMITQQLVNASNNAEKQAQELQTLRDQLNNTNEHEQEMTKQQSRYNDMENYYEEALSAKDIDIQTLRAQLNEALAAINQYTEQLAREASAKSSVEITVSELQQRLSEQTALLDEENKQLTEMRMIVEDQVVKIEELKKELFQKSNDYDSLIAEMDIERKATITTQQPRAVEPLHIQTSSSTSQTEQEKVERTPQRDQTADEDDLSEPVSRAELDLALYMLHQRDVRCEELMVELTQLLEERDTLQLRLSNAIREKEEIRRRFTEGGSTQDTTSTSTTSQDPSTPQSKSSAILLAASGIELASEPSESPSEQDLASKLSELRRVGYKKDKTFVDEQDLRRLQQMSIMQQHINDASRLPAEAAAKLVDASYTLSRDVQSPSKVLLNWLWGRSTPKVNDT